LSDRRDETRGAGPRWLAVRSPSPRTAAGRSVKPGQRQWRCHDLSLELAAAWQAQVLLFHRSSGRTENDVSGGGGANGRPAGHVVQFYDRDDELADSVGNDFGEALRAGSAVIVVATAAHRAALDGWLEAAGADVSAARNRGSFIALDAAETMRRFLIGDRPDPGGFEQAMGGLIRQAGAAGRPVRVYGEMVALLWEAGHVNAAIELEGLWNELGQRLPFSLWCGYRARSVAADDYSDALAEVCTLHSAVIGGRPAVPAARSAPGQESWAARTFEMAYGAPRAARHFVVETLRSWGDRALTDDAAIIPTELAANAVVHARSGFTVAVTRSADAVRISVRDDSPVSSADGDAPLAPSPGHDLGVVAAVASRWAVDPLAGGKMVWAEIR
jgi:MEDS: MEthanogen/methylotroph, DcmR Sensory domain